MSELPKMPKPFQSVPRSMTAIIEYQDEADAALRAYLKRTMEYADHLEGCQAKFNAWTRLDNSCTCDLDAFRTQRMKREGYWDGERHRWTPKGWKEITKWP